MEVRGAASKVRKFALGFGFGLIDASGTEILIGPVLCGLEIRSASQEAWFYLMTASRFSARVLECGYHSFGGHPIFVDLLPVGEDAHCESTAQEFHAGVQA